MGGAESIDVDALAKRLTAKQLMRWEAYAELEPFGEIRDDYRIASIVAAVYNVNRGKDQKPYTLDDVVVKFGDHDPKPKKQQSQADQFEVAKMWARMMALDPKEN